MSKQLNGAHLKWIAIISMLIDHIGAIPLQEYLTLININPMHDGFSHPLVIIYWICRLIGRLAFPLFSFLLVEGFIHTRNRYKYGFMMLIFFILSEVPFDLAAYNTTLELSHQNIYLTLFIGFITMVLIEKQNHWVSVMIMLLTGIANELLRGDYGLYGILMIGLIYMVRESRINQKVVVFILGLYQLMPYISPGLAASSSAGLIHLYSGKRGKQPKYFFYLFYPAHLFILYLITSQMLR